MHATGKSFACLFACELVPHGSRSKYLQTCRGPLHCVKYPETSKGAAPCDNTPWDSMLSPSAAWTRQDARRPRPSKFRNPLILMGGSLGLRLRDLPEDLQGRSPVHALCGQVH